MSNSLNDNDDNKIGDDTIDEGKEEKEDDARAWLQMELGGVAGHLASASLQSCARFVAEKTLLDVVWAASSQEGQGQGLGPAGRALHLAKKEKDLRCHPVRLTSCSAFPFGHPDRLGDQALFAGARFLCSRKGGFSRGRVQNVQVPQHAAQRHNA